MVDLFSADTRSTVDTQSDTKTLTDLPHGSGTPALQAVRQTVGVYPEYVSKGTRTLRLQEQKWHWKDVKYAVENAETGHVVCRVDDHGHSMHDEKNILGPDGELLFSMQNKCATLMKTFIVKDRAGQEVGRLRNTSVWKTALEFVFAAGAPSSSSGPAASGDTPLQVRGSIAQHEYEIVRANEVLAVVRKETGGKGYFKRDHSYTAHVAPGADAALVVCICVAADAVKHANQDGTMAAIAS